MFRISQSDIKTMIFNLKLFFIINTIFGCSYADSLLDKNNYHIEECYSDACLAYMNAPRLRFSVVSEIKRGFSLFGMIAIQR